jgi:transcriptional regulator with XRE-family HTH domain
VKNNKYKSMGDTLKAFREKTGMAQGELAKKLGYASPQFVSNWERGICGIPFKKAPVFCKMTGMKVSSMKELLLENERERIERVFAVKTKGKEKKKFTAVPVAKGQTDASKQTVCA